MPRRGSPVRKFFSMRAEKPSTPTRPLRHPQAETSVKDHPNVMQDGPRRRARFGGQGVHGQTAGRDGSQDDY
jgi:hypothetical protein